ncbi:MULTISPECIES: photosynthetic reaction center subunit H [unclassified Sphingomonas]|uniref:photosynthetic reaction center subunit H n=1 Tax=unclassified Sphingomonas TaxID=196159 RepID=UPI000830478E|nr:MULTISPECIES: photosynthetic reaction center subunit H [unclassified Sphingomonas]MCH4891969.1 photosynthetic reaction center subunit H [Sphingomonas sp. SFZ2018-12]
MDVQINEHIDVALITLNAFFLFFVGLIIYLRREDRREGFPLEDEMTGRLDTLGGPLLHGDTKYFKLPFGHGTTQAPAHGREPVDIAARRFERFPGAPYVPTGDPLVDGVGPAAYADRAKRPDVDWEGHPRIVPLGAASEFWIVKNDPDPRGMPVVGADGKVAGTVGEVWIDKADRLIRYLEVALADSGRSVLAPMFMATIERKRGRVVIDAITAAQFANAPEAGANGTITLYEEERVSAYFGGGYLYATPARQEPFL